MLLKIKEESENFQLNPQYFERENIKRFPRHYFRNIEKLGKGSYGKVYKYINLETRGILALKKISLKNIKHDEEKEKIMADLYIEQDFLNLISEANSKYLPKFEDVYYNFDFKANVPKSLYLASTIVEFKLQELLRYRKQNNKRNLSQLTKYF